MELKNRIIMPAMCTKLPNEFGAVTDRLIEFYLERAKGGVGLIITENTCIDWPIGKAAQNPLRIDDDKYIMGLAELADAVHFYDCKIATQPQHTGRQTSVTASTEGMPLVSASAVPCFVTGGDIPRALNIDEIIEIEDKFADAARRTKAAGMDCVEVHGAHGYLITQFISPYTNKRTDKYGGSLKNRMRFPLEIIEKIRKAVGEDFPIIFRFSADEYVEGGLTLEDNKIIAKSLEEAGVDILSVSAGIYESMHLIMPGMGTPNGTHVGLAEEIKKIVQIPIIAVGKIWDPFFANKIIREGRADLVAMGRALLAEPHLPSKAKRRLLKDIRPCIYCNQGCHGRVFKALRLSCSINPACGNEINYKFSPTLKPQKVLVLGGGPGGIEAALTASARGHKVFLAEKENKLGGKVLIGSTLPFKRELKPYLSYLGHQVDKSNISLTLGLKADLNIIKDINPDIVIVAVGAERFIPDIQGVNGPNVFHAEEIIIGNGKIGEKVIVLGGGQVGCETAWFLADKGKKVSIIEMLDEIAPKVPPASRNHLLTKLDELRVNIITNTYTEAIFENHIEIINKKLKEQKIETDNIIIATGYKPNKSFINQIKEIISEVHVIGDCMMPASIFEAVHSGSIVGRLI